MDYLYIEANAGGSSGGHVAIRFEDQVYHYQNDSFEILRMARDDYEDFRHLYSVLENRTIHIGRIETSDQTAAHVRDHFNERYLVQTRTPRRAGSSLRRDLELLEWLKRGGDDAPPLPGVGFFERGHGSPRPRRVSGSSRARARDHGDDALGRRIEALRADVASLRPGPVDSGGDPGLPGFRFRRRATASPTAIGTRSRRFARSRRCATFRRWTGGR